MNKPVVLEKDQELVNLPPDAAAQYAAQQWAEAFIAVQAELPDIKKTKTAKIQTNKGRDYSYTYADLSDIIAKTRPVLTKHGLAAVQDVSGNGSVSVSTRIYHAGGHVETFGPLTFPAGDDPKRAGSAITYARRYALGAALGIAPDEDTDGPPPQEPERPWYADHFQEFGALLLTATNDIAAQRNVPAANSLSETKRPSKASLAKILKRARELKSAGSSDNGATEASRPSSSTAPAAGSPQTSEDGSGSW